MRGKEIVWISRVSAQGLGSEDTGRHSLSASRNSSGRSTALPHFRTTTPGSYEVITDYVMDDFAKSKIAATNKELVEERAFVAEMISS